MFQVSSEDDAMSGDEGSETYSSGSEDDDAEDENEDWEDEEEWGGIESASEGGEEEELTPTEAEGPKGATLRSHCMHLPLMTPQ